MLVNFTLGISNRRSTQQSAQSYTIHVCVCVCSELKHEWLLAHVNLPLLSISNWLELFWWFSSKHEPKCVCKAMNTFVDRQSFYYVRCTKFHTQFVRQYVKQAKNANGLCVNNRSANRVVTFVRVPVFEPSTSNDIAKYCKAMKWGKVSDETWSTLNVCSLKEHLSFTCLHKLQKRAKCWSECSFINTKAYTLFSRVSNWMNYTRMFQRVSFISPHDQF